MILVTGATGLLGTHLLQQLQQEGRQLRAIYRSQPLQQFNNVEWVQADILDIISLEKAMEGIEQVYHCAGMVSFHPKQKAQLYKVNVQGTANVVNACISSGVKKLLHVSSVSAMGRKRNNVTVNESMQWTKETGNSEYGKSKYLAEMEVWRGIGEGLNAVMANPAVILGCSNWDDGSVAIFKNAYKEFPWFTDGVSGFVDVLDTVNAMIRLMESEASAERFIISAENIAFKEMFTMIANAFGKKPPHKIVSPLLAKLIWRIEAFKSFFTGKRPLLTKETADTAQQKVYFDNSKLLQQLPGFAFRPMQETVERICRELKEKYGLV